MDQSTRTQIAGPINLLVLMNGDEFAQFKLYFFRLPKGDYYVVEKGEVRGKDWIPVRIHSACNIAHLFHSQRCDCQSQLELAMKLIHYAGTGLLIYAVHHEGRGVGPFDHVRVYEKQDEGLDTVDSYIALGLPVDQRNYDECADILHWFEIHKIRLLTNNPAKVAALAKQFEIIREPLIARLNKYNQSQIKTKVEKLGHLIPYPEDNYGNDNHHQSGN